MSISIGGKNALVVCLILIVSVLLSSGCDRITNLKKAQKEEKQFLGYIEGYNPRIKEIEKILKESGLNPGPVDGLLDKQTRKAIKDFQIINKLTPTGYIDLKTKTKLDSIALENAKRKQSPATQRGTKGQINKLKKPSAI